MTGGGAVRAAATCPAGAHGPCRITEPPVPTYAAANAMVARLVDLGILEEFTGHARNRRFRHALYIALFHEEAG